MNHRLFKRNVQAWTFIILTIISFENVSYNQIREKSFNVDVHIKTDKTQYYTQEPIWVYIRVENREAEGPKMPDLALGEHFIVENSKGKRFYPKMHTDFHPLPPMELGQVIEEKFNLNLYAPSSNLFPYFLPPEMYKFYFQWREESYEPIVSNELEIVISDPTGDELHAFNLLKEGIQKYNRREDPDEPLDSLMNSYPQSCYLERAISLKMFSHMYKKEMVHLEKYMEASNKLLENFPESKYIISAFAGIREYYKAVNDLDGYKRYIRELDRKTKSERIKMTTNRILKKIEKHDSWDKIRWPEIEVDKKKSIKRLPTPPPPPPPIKKRKE